MGCPHFSQKRTCVCVCVCVVCGVCGVCVGVCVRVCVCSPVRACGSVLMSIGESADRARLI